MMGGGSGEPLHPYAGCGSLRRARWQCRAGTRYWTFQWWRSGPKYRGSTGSWCSALRCAGSGCWSCPPRCRSSRVVPSGWIHSRKTLSCCSGTRPSPANGLGRRRASTSARWAPTRAPSSGSARYSGKTRSLARMECSGSALVHSLAVARSAAAGSTGMTWCRSQCPSQASLRCVSRGLAPLRGKTWRCGSSTSWFGFAAYRKLNRRQSKSYPLRRGSGPRKLYWRPWLS